MKKILCSLWVLALLHTGSSSQAATDVTQCGAVGARPDTPTAPSQGGPIEEPIEYPEPLSDLISSLPVGTGILRVGSWGGGFGQYFDNTFRPARPFQIPRNDLYEYTSRNQKIPLEPLGGFAKFSTYRNWPSSILEVKFFDQYGLVIWRDTGFENLTQQEQREAIQKISAPVQKGGLLVVEAATNPPADNFERRGQLTSVPNSQEKALVLSTEQTQELIQDSELELVSVRITPPTVSYVFRKKN